MSCYSNRIWVRKAVLSAVALPVRRAAVGCVVLAAAGLQCFAAPIADEIVTASRPTDEQVAQVHAYVEPLLADLRGADLAARQEARVDALEPFLRSKVAPSVGFRVRYAAEIVGTLQAMLDAKAGVHAAVTSMRIAGLVATDTTAQLIRKGLRDDREQVRYMAAVGLAEMLRLAGDDAAALSARSMADVLKSAGEGLSMESSVSVLDGLLLAMLAPKEGSQLRGQTVLLMTEQLRQQLRTRMENANALRDVDVAVFLRGLGEAQRAIFAAAQAGQDFRTAAATMAGQALALAMEIVESTNAAELSPATLQRWKEFVAAAENVAVFSTDVPTNESVRKAFDVWAKGGDASGFRSEVEAWTGAGGRLTKAPYNAKPADFQAK